MLLGSTRRPHMWVTEMKASWRTVVIDDAVYVDVRDVVVIMHRWSHDFGRQFPNPSLRIESQIRIIETVSIERFQHHHDRVFEGQ